MLKDSGVQYDDKFVHMGSIGNNIQMPAKPGGPVITGWRSPLINHQSVDTYFKKLPPKTNTPAPDITQYLPAWAYLTKKFTIPKNTSNKPMAVYVCWRALSGPQTHLKIRLFDTAREIWKDSRGAPSMLFTQQYESPERTRQTACYGLYDVAYKVKLPKNLKEGSYHSEDYLRQANKKKSIKAFLGIKVWGQIEIASIKVFNPKIPPTWVTRPDEFPKRQDESTID